MSEKYRQISKCVLVDFVSDDIGGILTIGKGQHIDIFAWWGVGKSTLMGMIAKTRTLGSAQHDLI